MSTSDSFDFIVVGAGAAGCVLANRLTASGRHVRAASRSGRRGLEPVDTHSPGLRQALHQSRGELALCERAAGGRRQPADRATARQGDRRIDFDQRTPLYPRPAGGLRPLARSRQRGLELRRRAAVLPQGREPAARRGRVSRRGRAALRCRTRGRRTRCATRTWRQPRNAVIRATRISTARPRKASATTSGRCATDCAAARRPATCAPPAGAPTSRWSRARTRRASCSRARARPASSTCATASPLSPRPAGKCWWPAARSTRRSCSSSRASARLRCSQRFGIGVVTDLPVGMNLQDHYAGRMVYECTEPFTLNDIVGSLREERRRRAALRLSARRDSWRWGSRTRRASSAPTRRRRRPTSRPASRSTARTARATSCTGFPASPWWRGSCGPRAGAA